MRTALQRGLLVLLAASVLAVPAVANGAFQPGDQVFDVALPLDQG